MNRLGLKLSCLAVAVVIWVNVAATSVVEQDIRLPLRVTGLQPGLTIAGSDLPEEIPVRVKGSKLQLLNHSYFKTNLGEVRINLTGRNPGPPFVYGVDVTDIRTELDEASVGHLTKPLLIHIDREVSRKLPVKLTQKNRLPQDRAFLEAPSIMPDSALVTGPSRYFDPIPELAVGPVDLGEITSSDDLELDLTLPVESLQIEPSRVLASFSVATIEERTLANIPVIALVDAGRPEVMVSPPVADVMVRGVADSLLALTRDRLLVTIPVGNRPVGVYTLAGEVDYPQWLTLIGIDPPDFKVIVGDPPMVRTEAEPDSARGDSLE